MRRSFRLHQVSAYRSGLEEALAKQIAAEGQEVRFEQKKISFTQPEKPRKYTPDFELDNGILVESKGQFTTADRQKHLLLKAQYPEMDLRFVFSRSKARISKQSKTTYADWCETHGFEYSDGLIPSSWFKEPKKCNPQISSTSSSTAQRTPRAPRRTSKT